MSFEYFEKKHTNIEEKLIKEQGQDVCRQIISKHYINLQTKDYDFGFIHKINVAQIGQTRSRKTTSTTRVSSFILCKLHPNFEEIDINLVCSRPNSKDGNLFSGINKFMHEKDIGNPQCCILLDTKSRIVLKKLIELVVQKALELKFKYLSLLSIGNSKLVAWYKSQGFEVISEKMYPDGSLKAYSMKKRL
jgi:hypothetical protein